VKKKNQKSVHIHDKISSNKKSTMFVGIDIVLKNGKKVVGLAASSS
jgi:hypothetical protein